VSSAVRTDQVLAGPPDPVSEWLEQAKTRVRDYIAENGEKYFSIIRPSNEEGSPFERFARAPEVKDLLEQVASTLRPDAGFDSEVYNVLRIIAGPSGSDGACQFHYDATVLTMLVPLFIPEGEPTASGELVTFPAHRPYRRFVLTNLLDKAFWQNAWAWRRTERRVRANLAQHVQRLKPGNIYLFEGYRTLHGNLPCAPNSLRATMLLHHGDPHDGSTVLGAILSGRKLIETRRRTTRD
jgi:hypothetical protein